MSRRHSIADARNNLPELVRQSESGKPVELTRRGEPGAVLVGRRDYDRLPASSGTFGRAWEKFARDVDLRQANIDPDEVFADVRDDAPGRESEL
jgi:cellobiose PTS system EIIB component